MPKVVIELQANTQAAVQQIQKFAKAQKDAFDAVRAGNPALAEASVKVSKLTDSTENSVKATDQANKALRGLAMQGMAPLANAIPGVSGALGQLAQTLGTFPLLIGAAWRVGIGFAQDVAAVGGRRPEGGRRDAASWPRASGPRRRRASWRCRRSGPGRPAMTPGCWPSKPSRRSRPRSRSSKGGSRRRARSRSRAPCSDSCGNRSASKPSRRSTPRRRSLPVSGR